MRGKRAKKETAATGGMETERKGAENIWQKHREMDERGGDGD